MKTSLVLGHRGLVGQAIMRKLPGALTHLDDLTETSIPHAEHVYLAASRVGGIGYNVEAPADIIRTNLAIAGNVIADCARLKSKLLFLGSSCIYPVLDRPIKETDLLTGPLEPTNRAYAVAKIAGVEMCRAYAKQYGLRCVILMPCNVYGPGRFEQDTHVINMLMKRFHEAKVRGDKSVTVWGSGRALREFMHVDDLAEACVHFMLMGLEAGVEAPIINVGTEGEISVRNLAGIIAGVVGFRGELVFDPSKPDGAPRKVLDCSLAHSLGWKLRVELGAGLERTYAEYLRHLDSQP